jgi:hypothetical protein
MCLGYLRALRGGRLDHEDHEMSEKHEPAGAAMYPALPRLAGDIASGRAEEPRSFSRKFGSPSQIFVKKKVQIRLLEKRMSHSALPEAKYVPLRGTAYIHVV